MSPYRLATALVALVIITTTTSAPLRGQAAASEIRAAIEERLSIVPRGFERLASPAQSGVRVLNVQVERASASRQRVTIDLSQRALTYDPSGESEVLLDQVLQSVARLTPTGTEFRFLVDGVPLDQFVPRPTGRWREQDVIGRGPVLISAGHGWYWNENWGQWLLQRSYWWGIVEDFVNWEIAGYLLDELRLAGMAAHPARHPDRLAPGGVSGQPLWQESAKYFIRAAGAPPHVSDFGANEYNRDINSRPFYANWIDAAAIVSIHNNGGRGTGTETWYDETNGWAEQSRHLAQLMNDTVVRHLRERYNPAWPDRGLRSCNGCKGETRLAMRPAVILEVAFMDTQWPDNTALHDDVFKRIVAQAIREALQVWSAQTPGLPPVDGESPPS